MSESCALVKLAQHLNYKVYKEVIELDFNSAKNASYRVKNNRGEIFASSALSQALANAIKNDLKISDKSRRG